MLAMWVTPTSVQPLAVCAMHSTSGWGGGEMWEWCWLCCALLEQGEFGAGWLVFCLGLVEVWCSVVWTVAVGVVVVGFCLFMGAGVGGFEPSRLCLLFGLE